MNSQLLLDSIKKNPNKSKIPESIAMPGDNHQAPQDESTELQYGIKMRNVRISLKYF